MEIHIVEVVNGEDLVTKTQAYRNVDDAEKAFINEVRKLAGKGVTFTDDDIEDFLSDGYYNDDTHFSVIIKDIILN